MENQSNESIFNLRFDEHVKQSLKGAAMWAGLAAILSLIGAILGIVNYFLLQGKMKSYQIEGFQEYRTTESTGPSIGSAIVGLVLGIFLFYYLNRFANKTKAGVGSNDALQIGDGLGSLSTYFKILGVVLIIGITLAFLGGLMLGLKS